MKFKSFFMLLIFAFSVNVEAQTTHYTRFSITLLDQTSPTRQPLTGKDVDLYTANTLNKIFDLTEDPQAPGFYAHDSVTIGSYDLYIDGVISKITDRLILTTKLISIASNFNDSGEITVTGLADNFVTSSKIVDGSIGTVDLANNSVTGAKIETSSLAVLLVDGTTVSQASGVISVHTDVMDSLRTAYLRADSLRNEQLSVSGTYDVGLTSENSLIFVIDDDSTDNNTRFFDIYRNSTTPLDANLIFRVTEAGVVTGLESAEPGTPSDNHWKFWGGLDGKPYFKNEEGTLYDLSSEGTGTVTGITNVGNGENVLLNIVSGSLRGATIIAGTGITVETNQDGEIEISQTTTSTGWTQSITTDTLTATAHVRINNSLYVRDSLDVVYVMVRNDTMFYVNGDSVVYAKDIRTGIAEDMLGKLNYSVSKGYFVESWQPDNDTGGTPGTNLIIEDDGVQRTASANKLNFVDPLDAQVAAGNDIDVSLESNGVTVPYVSQVMARGKMSASKPDSISVGDAIWLGLLATNITVEQIYGFTSSTDTVTFKVYSRPEGGPNNAAANTNIETGIKVDDDGEKDTSITTPSVVLNRNVWAEVTDIHSTTPTFWAVDVRYLKTE